MFLRWFILFSSLLVLHTIVAECQVLPFDIYGVDNGLPSDFITALFQDSRGVLWIGTSEGLSEFDGIGFTNHSPVNGLPFAFTTLIGENPRTPGEMWFGAREAGLVRYVNGKFTTFRFDSGGIPNNVTALCIDHAGTVWCTTSKGMFRLRQDSITSVRSPFYVGAAEGFVAHGDSVLWIASYNGLFRMRIADQAIVPVSWLCRRTEFVGPMTMLDDGTLWIGTRDGTLLHLRDTMLLEERDLHSSGVMSLLDDRKGHLWAATSDGLFKIGLSENANVPPAHITVANGLPENLIMASLCDRENNLWFGTFHSGLLRLADVATLRFPNTGSAQSPNSASAALDGRGHIWTSSETGLDEFWQQSPGIWQHQQHLIGGKTKIPHSSIIVADGHSALWVGAERGEFRKFAITQHPGANSDITLNEILPRIDPLRNDDDLLCFLPDNDGGVWESINRVGVLHIGSERPRKIIKNFSAELGMPENSIRAMFCDHTGRMWFGGYSNGLSSLVFDAHGHTTVHHYSTGDGLPDNGVRSIAEDSLGRLWIGTRYGGLAVFDGQRFRSFTVKDGLLSNAVWALAAAREGMMLLATQHGLQTIRLSADGSISWSTLASGMSMYACGLTPDGIEFGVSREGLTLHGNPDDLLRDVAPAIEHLSLAVNGKPQSLRGELQFEYDQNNCSISYLGISLRNGPAVRYRYRLDPVDADWQAPTADRTVNYAALKPGSYHFRVESVRGDGTLSGHPAEFAFTIVPPFWLRWWFFVLVIVIVGGSIAGVIRFRVRRLLEIERIRARIATDLHDDIGSGLTRIAILAEVAVRQIESLHANAPDPGTAGELRSARSAEGAVHRVGVIARELVDTMTDVVWSIDPRHDAVVSFTRRVRAVALELCEARDITLSFTTDAAVDAVRLGPELRRNLFSVTKEALTNVVKHTQCTAVTITLAVEHGRIKLTVSDNGSGFDEENRRSEGNGLLNMQRRMQRVGGTLTIESTPGSGTTLIAIAHLSDNN